LHDNPKLQLLSRRHQSFPWNSPPLHISCAQQLLKYKSSSTSDPTTPRYAMPSSPAPKLTSPSAYHRQRESDTIDRDHGMTAGTRWITEPGVSTAPHRGVNAPSPCFLRSDQPKTKLVPVQGCILVNATILLLSNCPVRPPSYSSHLRRLLRPKRQNRHGKYA
jgi:hypothetical protein